MKKQFYLVIMLVSAMFIQFTGSGQYYVPTDPMNKNAILEEFTGVKCPNCPAGHQVLAQILEANPGRAFGIAFHPFNSSYTLPYPGDPDFRRHYADSLYMMPYCGTSRYMPSAFVSRRLWAPPERLTQRTNWAGYTAAILAEASPLNVGMATAYDEGTKILSVTVDLYYTAALAVPHNLMVTLAENNLVSQQSGATGQYTHKHTFREAFTGQWGDPVSSGGGQGTYYRQVFTFNNTDSNYVMANCELLAYVVDNTSTEVITGIGCNVGDTTYTGQGQGVGITFDTLWFDTPLQCDGSTTTLYNGTSEPIDLTYVQQDGYDIFSWMVEPWPFQGFPHTLAPGDSVDLQVVIILPISNGKGYLYDTLLVVTAAGEQHIILAANDQLFTNTGSANAGNGLSLSNHPNPFAGSTRVEVHLAEAGELLLEVYDLNGLKVKTLAGRQASSGTTTLVWDGRSDRGTLLSPGIYILHLKTDHSTLVRRCVIVR